MLQKLNERIQGVIAWVVIVFIAITFTLFGIDYYMQARGTNNTEVEVNNQSISKQLFDVTFRRFRQQRDPTQLTSISEKQLKSQVLDEMILNEVSVQAAQHAGFYVSKAEADSAIVNIPQFQEDGGFSSAKYQQAISGALYTAESFQKQVQQGMLLNQQRFSFIGNSFALPGEIERFVKLFMQTRDYQYLLIPSKLFINDTHVTDDEVNRYYLTHKKDFLSAELVSVDYLQLSLNDIKADVKINDALVKRYYDDNKGNYLSPAKWQVAHILFAFPTDANGESQKRIHDKARDAYTALKNNPAQFEQWVKTVSDDKLSASQDGLLPWMIAGETEFDSTLATLKQVGQLSKPVKTNRGYEIFKLVSMKSAALKPFASVEAQIKNQLISDTAQQQYMQLLEQLSDLSYQTPDTLTSVAEVLKLPIQHTKPFSHQGGDTMITKNSHLINAAFSHDVLELGNNSEPIQIDPNTVVVLRVNQHIPEKEMPLSMVANTIKQQLAQDKARELSKAFGQTLLATIQNNKPYTSVLKDKHLEWKPVKNATRESDKVLSLVNDLAFSIPTIEAEQGKSIANGDFVIVKLDAINDGKLSQLDNEQQSNLLQQIETSYGLMDYDLYINQLMKTAKIVKH